MPINIYEAKTNFSKVISRVEAGEEIIIARAGRPVARIVPLNAPPGERSPGSWAGQIRMADDFDDPLPEEWMSELEP